MASCSCGTRDKPKPVSPLSRGLWLPGCCMRLAFRNWADIFLMLGALGPNGLGAPSRFLGFAPLRVRIPPLAHIKAPWAVMGSGRSVLMAGTEGFEPPTAGTKNRSSTVELRPNVWCCPKATRLVYLICEGIANAIEQAYGECLRVAGREGAVVARHARELNANACRLLLCGDIGSADALG